MISLTYLLFLANFVYHSDQFKNPNYQAAFDYFQQQVGGSASKVNLIDLKNEPDIRKIYDQTRVSHQINIFDKLILLKYKKSYFCRCKQESPVFLLFDESVNDLLADDSRLRSPTDPLNKLKDFYDLVYLEYLAKNENIR